MAKKKQPGSKTLLELKKESARLRLQIHEIEQTEDEKKYRHLLGKAFVTTNNYSCPKTKADYWKLYMKVTKVVGSHIEVKKFQIDCNGNANLDVNHNWFAHMVGEYTEISNKKWDAEFSKFIKYIEEQK